MSGSGISWDICKSAPHSRQITTPAPHYSVFMGRMPFLPPNQQRQSTECISLWIILIKDRQKSQCSSVADRPRVDKWMKQIDEKVDDDQQQSKQRQRNIDQLHDVNSHVRIVNIARRVMLHSFKLCQLTHRYQSDSVYADAENRFIPTTIITVHTNNDWVTNSVVP